MAMESENTLCESCGSALKVVHDGGAAGLGCPQCGSPYPMIYFPQIRQDPVSYAVRIHDGDFHDQDDVKAVAEIVNVNFLLARKILEEDQPVVFIGKAIEVQEVRERLMSAGLTYTINPEFPW